MTVKLVFPKGSVVEIAEADHPAELVWALQMLGVHRPMRKDEWQQTLTELAEFWSAEYLGDDDEPEQPEGGSSN